MRPWAMLRLSSRNQRASMAGGPVDSCGKLAVAQRTGGEGERGRDVDAAAPMLLLRPRTLRLLLLLLLLLLVAWANDGGSSVAAASSTTSCSAPAAAEPPTLKLLSPAPQLRPGVGTRNQSVSAGALSSRQSFQYLLVRPTAQPSLRESWYKGSARLKAGV